MIRNAFYLMCAHPEHAKCAICSIDLMLESAAPPTHRLKHFINNLQISKPLLSETLRPAAADRGVFPGGFPRLLFTIQMRSCSLYFSHDAAPHFHSAICKKSHYYIFSYLIIFVFREGGLLNAETIIQLVGSVGLPGVILLLLIFLANKHLPVLVHNLHSIEINLALLTTSINSLLHRIDDKIS